MYDSEQCDAVLTRPLADHVRWEIRGCLRREGLRIDRRSRMTIRRWVPLAVFFVALFVTRNAGASVISFATSPVDTGNTVIGGTPGSATGTLSSDSNGDNVDLVVTGTCSVMTGSDTFTATALGNATTNINL